jgi:hypothetical protein
VPQGTPSSWGSTSESVSPSCSTFQREWGHAQNSIPKMKALSEKNMSQNEGSHYPQRIQRDYIVGLAPGIASMPFLPRQCHDRHQTQATHPVHNIVPYAKQTVRLGPLHPWTHTPPIPIRPSKAGNNTVGRMHIGFRSHTQCSTPQRVALSASPTGVAARNTLCETIFFHTLAAPTGFPPESTNSIRTSNRPRYLVPFI